MLPAQCRMARAALGMKIAELAELANVSTNTVVRFERGEELKSATVRSIKGALQRAGISFIPENGGGAGVRFSMPTNRKSIESS
nr:helix-turn-helix transcriptional regulator [Xaviernesmea rhizosphaerae]